MLQGQSSSFSTLLSANYSQNFGKQSAILQHLNDILTPIAEAGPGQEGFTPTEKAALNTRAIDTTAGNYRNAAQAVGNSLAGRGDSTLESGVDQQIKGTIASEAAGKLSSEELGITEADYATGRENWKSAVSGLGGVAAAENPGAIAGEATNANQGSFSEAKSNAEASSAWVQDIAGLAGGALSGWASSGFKH